MKYEIYKVSKDLGFKNKMIVALDSILYLLLTRKHRFCAVCYLCTLEAPTSAGMRPQLSSSGGLYLISCTIHI